jgi:6,7-dimethyl-8-ribityllumazine synthase
MPATIDGKLSAAGCSFAVVVGRVNSLVTNQLLHGALDCLTRHGADEGHITVVHCPGSFEIPQVAHQLATSGMYDGIVCLGCVIKGETPHFEYLAGEVTRGLGQVALQSGVPIGFGVLTTLNLEQALERAGAKAGNKGWDASLSVIEMVNLRKQLAGGKKRAKG